MLNRRPIAAQESGFTLVEMIVTVLILIILSAIALPAFQGIIAKVALKSTAESIYQGLQVARAEAVRQNTRVHATISANTAWSVVVDSTNAVVQSKPAGEGANAAVTLAGTGTVTFNALGRATANSDGSNPLTKIDITSTDTTTARRIQIGFGGVAGSQLTLCDPNAPAGDSKACQ
jgi:type IV fimbrial biogenesis protein FimT